MRPVENVQPIISPNREAMADHLAMLFGRALHGRIEITAIHVEHKEKGIAPRTSFFDLDRMEDAAAKAAEYNSEPCWNVYVGAALRREDVFPGKAANDQDFQRTYAVWADADNEAQLQTARKAYDGVLDPPFVVVTGRTPEKRAQLWWPLETPIDDIDTLRATLSGIAHAFGTDRKVCTGKQLMRLAGSVAWPKVNKPGRIVERTEIVRVSRAAREFTLEQLHSTCPPVSRLEASAGLPDVEVGHGGALGLEEKITDGREGYAFGLIRAHLVEHIGTTGCEPTPEELYRSAWPVYFQKADQIRPGRGPTFFLQKCVECVRAFRSGQIPFAKTLDDAVQTYAAKRHEITREASGDDEFAEGEAEPAKPLTFNLMAWTAAAYAGAAKPIEWLCEGTIPLGQPVLFASMGGLGKSFIAVDLGLVLAVGVVASLNTRPILGGAVVQSGTAVILSAEDSRDSIHRRLERIDPERLRDRNPDKLIIVPLPDLGGPRPLIASDGKTLATTQAFADLKAELAAIPDLKLIVIDPLQAFVMADVNADPAAGQFMWSAFASLCAATGATLIVAHHMRKDGAASITTADQAREAIRGSTALVDGARLTYALWKAGPEDGRDMCARLDVDFAPERIAFGAVVKANDEASRDIQTYVRGDSGLLMDATGRIAAVKAVDSVTPKVAQEIVEEIGQAFRKAVEGRGEGYAPGYQSGERYAARLIMRRSGCSIKEAKELLEAWLANGIMESRVINKNTKKSALCVVGRLG